MDGTQQIILGIKVIENGAFRGVTQAGDLGRGGPAKSLMSKRACGGFSGCRFIFWTFEHYHGMINIRVSTQSKSYLFKESRSRKNVCRSIHEPHDIRDT